MAEFNNGEKLFNESMHGVEITIKKMPNGEMRYRITEKSIGLVTSITSTLQGGGGWQNSHRHSPGVLEQYCIQQGWVLLAEKIPGENVPGDVVYRLHSAHASFEITSQFAHNLYVAPNTLFQTTKFGNIANVKDFDPVPELDAFLAAQDISKILPARFKQ